MTTSSSSLRVFFHGNVKGRAGLLLQLRFSVADVTKFQYCAFRCVEREFTLQVGNSTLVVFVLHFDGYTDHRFPSSIDHGTVRFGCWPAVQWQFCVLRKYWLPLARCVAHHSMIEAAIAIFRRFVSRNRVRLGNRLVFSVIH